MREATLDFPVRASPMMTTTGLASTMRRSGRPPRNSELVQVTRDGERGKAGAPGGSGLPEYGKRGVYVKRGDPRSASDAEDGDGGAPPSH